MTRHAVSTEGATLAYEKAGAGPLLIMIAGAGGLGSAYRKAAALLAGQYTVITYDRRCRGSSTGNRDLDLDLDLDQQARDAAAIIRDADAGSAYPARPHLRGGDAFDAIERQRSGDAAARHRGLHSHGAVGT
jgi:pimeloyl-ACP methyl ester carboxylesterase